MSGRIVHTIALAALVAMAAAGTSSAIPVVERLENGMTLIFEEDHSRPLVAACLFVKGGSRTEPDSLKGLSHYYEHLIFRGGSTRQEPMEYRKTVQDIGEESGGYTTDDYTCYGYTVPTEHLDEMIWRSADAWFELIPDQEKVDIERKVVMTEYWQGRDRPDYLVWYQLVEAFYTHHAYHTPTIGLREVIEEADLATFRAFYNDRYVPNQMVLAMVGDFETADLSRALRQELGSHPRGRESFELGFVDPPQEEFRLATGTAETPMTQFDVAFRIPPARDPIQPTLRVLGAVLGGGRSSRLYLTLKERQSLVQDVSTEPDRRFDDGMLVIWGSFEPENERETLAATWDEVARLANEPIEPAELEAVKRRLIAEDALNTQTFFDRAEHYAWFETVASLELAFVQDDLIASVTADDVQAAARRFLRPENATLSLVRPEETDASDEDLLADVKAWGRELSGEGPAADASDGGLTEVKLEGGMPLIIKTIPADRVVAAAARFSGGQWTEPDGNAGVASLAARSLRKGTPSLSAEEFSAELDRLGARFTSTATADAIEVTLLVPAPSFAEAFALYLDALTAPAFGSDELESAMTEQLGEIASLAEEPFRYTNRRFDAEIYANSPYMRSILGDSASVEGLSLDDVRDYIGRNLVSERAAMSIVGPVDPHTVAAAVQGAFEGRRGERFEFPTVSEGPLDAAREIWVEKTQGQVTYNTGWPSVGMRHADFYPLEIATSILGRRFFYEFVYEKSLAYRSWFYMRDRMGPSVIQNEMGVSPDDYEYASSGILEGVTEFVDGEPDEAAVASAKNRITSRFAIRQQDPLGLARLLTIGGQLGMGAAYLQAYPEAVRAVESTAVYETARRYMHPDRYIRVAVGKRAAPVN